MRQVFLRHISSLMLALLIGSPAAAVETIQVKGSDTIIKLTQRLSEEFHKLRSDISVEVSGGGSGYGINAVIAGHTDIADSSREVKNKEQQRAAEKNVELFRVVLAFDAVAVVVHKANPVDRLSLDQLGRIFRGEVTNWSAVGGEDLGITLYGRGSVSGTFDVFRQRILHDEYSMDMVELQSNAAILEMVKNDRSAIGYISVAHLKGADMEVKALSLADNVAAEYIDPLQDDPSFLGRYPLTRPLYQYLDGAPQGAVKDLIAFELGPQGQRIVAEEGFFPVCEKFAE